MRYLFGRLACYIWYGEELSKGQHAPQRKRSVKAGGSGMQDLEEEKVNGKRRDCGIEGS
jgi:hypothetical protein